MISNCKQMNKRNNKTNKINKIVKINKKEGAKAQNQLKELTNKKQVQQVLNFSHPIENYRENNLEVKA